MCWPRDIRIDGRMDGWLCGTGTVNGNVRRQNGEEKNHKSCNQTRQGIFSAGRVMNVWLITKAISLFYYYFIPFFLFSFGHGATTLLDMKQILLFKCTWSKFGRRIILEFCSKSGAPTQSQSENGRMAECSSVSSVESIYLVCQNWELIVTVN